MTTYYFITAVFAIINLLIMVHSYEGKKINANFTFMALLMALANAGYLSIALSTSIHEAILANKVVYAGGCFVPPVLLFSTCVICNYKVSDWLRSLLYLYSFIVYAMVLTIGFNNFYYSEVYLDKFDDATVLGHHYGIGHNFFYVIIYGYVVVEIILLVYSVKKNNTVSRKSLYAMIIMETVNCALFLAGRILNPAIEIMPLMYVADGWILLYLHHRAMMYNIEDCIISSLGKQETYGYIMFDNDLNYLGCNNIAHQIFPELSECRVDLPIRNMSKVEVLLHWIAEYSKEVRENFSYENGDRHYQCSIERIWHKEKGYGYIVEMQEDTDRWHYMNLLSSYNSELERYAKEQEELKAQAEEANKAKGEFLANMSHEIRTPINAVLGMDEMILRESREPEIQSYAADIRRAGNILLSLINDILDFSKIESGKMDIIPVEYDLGMVLHELMDMIRSRAEEKNLLLELKVEPDTPAHLFGDEVRIRQIIINILTNAVKYTPEGKVTLTVSAKKVSEDSVQLYVSVKDTGIGIKEEDRERLFDSFQRVEETRNRNIEGTGLGLSITMRLLNLMGSRLEVESTYGVGSNFYFYLEQKQMDEQVIGDIQKKYEQEKGKINISTEPFYAPEAKILVVDDNEMNLKVFLGLLKGHGMQIDTATCGKDCLSLMEQKSYHIVFMDHLMPELDGVETLKQARELKNNLSKDAVMIALTANAVSGAREMFLEEGFQDYLAKPIIAIQLEKMILNYLPKALIQNADSEQPELLVSEFHGNAPAAKAENDIVDWERGRAFCAGDEDFYTEILRTFLDDHSDTTLSQYYEASDFENYRVKIHAVKTNLANIGAVDASEMAKKLELALKNEEDVNYVKAHHEEFIRVYKKVVSKVEKYVYGGDQR